MKHFVLYIILLLSGGVSSAQKYGYRLVEGWQSSAIFQEEDSSFKVFGLASDFSHTWLSLSLNKNMYIVESGSYKSDTRPTSWRHGFNVEKVNSKYIVSGFVNSKSDYFQGLLAMFDESSSSEVFTPFDSFNLSWRTFPVQGFWHDSLNYVTFGAVVHDSVEPNSTTLSFFRKVINGNPQPVAEYTCEGFSGEGGCNFVIHNAVQTSDGYMVSARAAASYHQGSLMDPIVIKVDTLGKELWRLDLGNDSTSGHNLIVAPLARGNYLATYMDYQWKPKRKPPDYDNRNPELNHNTTIQCVIFNERGEVVRSFNLSDELRFKSFYDIHVARHNHTILTTDSSVVIVGNTEDKGINGNHLGYILKLNNLGEYQWYRQLQLNINGGDGLERLYINGITELKNGGFALAGEYRSEKSDSFEFGIQSGVVLLVDEFGCQEPGCQLNDWIEPVGRKANLVKVYPNPSNGMLHIETIMPGLVYGYKITNSVGAIVQLGEITGRQEIELTTPGFYFIFIQSSTQGFWDVKKIVIQ